MCVSVCTVCGRRKRKKEGIRNAKAGIRNANVENMCCRECTGHGSLMTVWRKVMKEFHSTRRTM